MDSEQNNRRQRSGGFSLLELLVVIAVLLILVSMASLGMNQILQSVRMERAGRMILEEIQVARQFAASRNLSVELRVIEKPRGNAPGGPVFWCLQSGVRDKANTGNFTPVSRMAQLPAGVALAPEPGLSSIIGSLTPLISTHPAYRYIALVIRPTGALEPVSGLPLNQPWFMTAVPENKLGAPLADISDFVTVQIDPWTAQPTLYRP